MVPYLVVDCKVLDVDTLDYILEVVDIPSVEDSLVVVDILDLVDKVIVRKIVDSDLKKVIFWIIKVIKRHMKCRGISDI